MGNVLKMIDSAPSQKVYYPIRKISELTGINPVTLRAWERRYNIIRPQRTAKGHRLYSPADIDRVHSPIGLAIGAETPEEIAVSIVAELIAERAARRVAIPSSPGTPDRKASRP